MINNKIVPHKMKKLSLILSSIVLVNLVQTLRLSTSLRLLSLNQGNLEITHKTITR